MDGIETKHKAMQAHTERELGDDWKKTDVNEGGDGSDKKGADMDFRDWDVEGYRPNTVSAFKTGQEMNIPWNFWQARQEVGPVIPCFEVRAKEPKHSTIWTILMGSEHGSSGERSI